MTLQDFSLPFNVQVMIPVGSYGFFNFASISVDRCYLYIITNYGMSQRDLGIRSVPRAVLRLVVDLLIILMYGQVRKSQNWEVLVLLDKLELVKSMPCTIEVISPPCRYQ